jgi:hypothetical protein
LPPSYSRWRPSPSAARAADPPQAALVGPSAEDPRHPPQRRALRRPRQPAGGQPRVVARHLRDQRRLSDHLRIEGRGPRMALRAGWPRSTKPSSCVGAAGDMRGSSTERSRPFAQGRHVTIFPKARPPTAAMYWAFTGPCCRPPLRPGHRCSPSPSPIVCPTEHPGAGLRRRPEPAGQPARHRGGTGDRCPAEDRRAPVRYRHAGQKGPLIWREMPSSQASPTDRPATSPRSKWLGQAREAPPYDEYGEHHRMRNRAAQ